MKDKAKRRISQRELWLASLLPAALVIIISLGLPNKSDEIDAVERRLEQAASAETIASQRERLRELATELEESREALDALTAQETDLLARIQALQAPVAGRTQSLAQALDALTRRLAVHRVQVLAVTGAAGAVERDWQVSVAATWQDVREALAEPDTFPPGLALAALHMAPTRPAGGSAARSGAGSSLALRRWELLVSDLGSGR
jgi:DNA-binding transcriptional MerR regulator